MYLLKSDKKTFPVYWIDNFLSDEEIKKIFEHAENLDFEIAGVGHKKIEKKKKQFTLDYHIKNPNIGNVPRSRTTNIKWIDLNEKTEWLFKKIISQICKVNLENFDMILKFIENLQFSEYTEIQNGFYLPHVDCGEKDMIENYVDIRKLSFTIQLSEEKEYEGGELIFHIDGEKKVAPKTKGTIIFFKSDILHEVTPVKKGNRYSLVSWVSGPNLK